ncbi:MAG: bifunctional ADP-dependent NAD(P)H-hydrate dehydratase/NAD(P)H-hydrate epimerase [Persephonella sp.]|nr:MAG: bifunctional ADP-dependent NAD(P)H-hydrate dehydratase/NAD(P)H-hydrate epimerase [Persephonella sp.]
MKVLKSYEMAEIDRLTIQKTGINSLVLMENAGRTASEIILDRYRDKKIFVVVAGSGNNGGDGLVVARYLKLYGKDVKVFILSKSEDRLSDDNKANLKVLRNIGINPVFINDENLNLLEEGLKDAEVIIDAIFGTGFKPPVKGYRENAIKLINNYGKSIVAIDIPSGLSTDVGNIEGTYINADLTITFAYPKLAHILFPSSLKCGDIYVIDISIDRKYSENIKREILNFSNISLPVRYRDSHKYTYGHTLIIGGSVGKTGAVIMSAKSSSAIGSGLVSVVIPSTLNQIFEISLTEEMSIPVKDTGNGYFSKEAYKDIKNVVDNGKYTSIALGMGMSVYKDGKDLVKNILENIDLPILIDADGLNNLSQISDFKDILRSREGNTVLTPHIGEMARLTGLNSKDIINNMEDVAKKFAEETKSTVVLKGSRTVIATDDGEIYYSIRGTEGMATAGTGDILAGLTASLIYRLGIKEGVKAGVFIHGLAGEFATEKKHKESVKATDLIDFIPNVLKYIEMEKEKVYYKFFVKLYK